MFTIDREFKGKQEKHIVLDPDDIDQTLTVLKISKNSIGKIPPWNNPHRQKDYIKIINWLHDKIKDYQLNK